MSSSPNCTRPPSPAGRPTPPNAFAPSFLAQLHEHDEALTAAEAATAGPWKVEPVPDRPGRMAVLRQWESLEAGDRPAGVFVHEEHARLFAALLPLVGREPLFHLSETADPEEGEGYAVTATYGEQGPCEVAWLDRCEPELAAVLHVGEGMLRSPAALAALLRAAGGGAVEQVGRILAGEG
jgi:hypothetical protein